MYKMIATIMNDHDGDLFVWMVVIAAVIIHSIFIFSFIRKMSKEKELVKRAFIYPVVMLVEDLVSVVLYVVIAGTEITMIPKGIFNVITGEYDWNYHNLFQLGIINLVIIYAGYRFCILLLKKDKELLYRETGVLLLAMLVECMVIDIIGIYSSDNMLKIFKVLLAILTIPLNMWVTRLVHRLIAARQYKHELELLKKQNEVQLEHYKELSEKYEKSRKLAHDIKNHMAIVSEMKGKDSEYDEKANEYGKNICAEVESIFGGFRCSNDILSTIMSQKISASESENIKVQIDVEDISFENISDIDITAIFANLWDNAIEALRGIKGDEKLIKVMIMKKNRMVFIGFENGFRGEINTKEGGFLSTKENHQGLGLSIVKETVEKYGGNIKVNVEDKVFKVKIIMPVE